MTKNDIIDGNVFNAGMFFLISGVYAGLVFRYKGLKPIHHTDCFKEQQWSPKVIIFKSVIAGIFTIPYLLISG